MCYPCEKSQENTKFRVFLAVGNRLFLQSGDRAAPFSLDHLAMVGMQLFFFVCVVGWVGFFLSIYCKM